MAKPTPESEPTRIEGSFRDPAGQIFEKDGRIFRTVNAPAAEDFAFVQNTDFYSKAIVEKRLIDAQQVPLHVLNGHGPEASCVIEHPRLPFVSYPYEWTFRMLKTAALFHLDFHIDALAEGITLVDASAYNVQFIGASPIFIDTLSLRRYEPGALWTGYKQFCDQFLNPLLLHSYVGLHHNAWYRGSQEGITAGEIRKLLPARRKLSRRVLTHVTLQDSLQKTTRKGSGPNLETLRAAGLPLPVFTKTLANLRDWIAGLEPKIAGPTEWSNYAKANSYAPQEEVLKQEFVADFVRREKPRQVWDLGCNSGEYAAVCLEAGADYVVGFDSDHGALDLAFRRARGPTAPLPSSFSGYRQSRTVSRVGATGTLWTPGARRCRRGDRPGADPPLVDRPQRPSGGGRRLAGGPGAQRSHRIRAQERSHGPGTAPVSGGRVPELHRRELSSRTSNACIHRTAPNQFIDRAFAGRVFA